MLTRTRKFARRALAAQRLGLSFWGTSRFAPPRAAVLRGARRALSFPAENPLALDVIDLWLDDDYGLETITRPVETVIDVGANVGLFSLWAWRCFPDAKIHAYEPNPALQAHLALNLGGVSKIVLHAEGVADAAGAARMECGECSRLGQTILGEAGDIPIVALTTAVARIGGRVDLLKLDCEGAEWTIFRAPEAFANVREIRMEYHLTDGRTLDDLREAAATIGFDITFLRENAGFGIAYLSNRRQRSGA
jgi:FkbM family methyltransferase